jgi:hypothetical protein
MSVENGSSKSLTSKESPLDLLSDVSGGAESGKSTQWLGGERRIGSAVIPRMERGFEVSS